MTTGILLVLSLSLVVGSLTLPTAEAATMGTWVPSISSIGLTGPGGKTSLGDVEVQIEVQPTVLNLESQGVYTVFLTFPEDDDYGKTVEEISGKTIILQFKTQNLDATGFKSGDEVLLVVQGTLIDGTSFGGSILASLTVGSCTFGPGCNEPIFFVTT